MVVGEFTQEADLVVIGAGPGGYAAAFRAAELGVSTVVVDASGEFGGVCLHRGCIPSKTLLHVAETLHVREHARQLGITFGEPAVDLHVMRQWINQTRATLAKGLAATAKRLDVEMIQGRASFADSRSLNVVDGAVPRIRFRRAIIATGTRPMSHSALPFDGELIFDPSDAMEFDTIPERLLIVGGGYMAIELASVFAALGSEVTLAHAGDRWLPEVDADLARPLVRVMSKRLSAMTLNVQVAEATPRDTTVEVRFTGQEAPASTTFDRVIVATGREADVSALHLDRTQVQQNDTGFIRVDEQLRTTDPRIFAVGDVAGGALLADIALAQGRLVGEVIAGWNATLDVRAVPAVIFSDPQIAWCGLTEGEAKARGIVHEIVKVPWGASGRAVSMGRTDGVTKIIYDPDAKLILGVGIAGKNAAELISEGALAIEMGAVLDDLAETIHPHPTVSELISEAALRAASGK